MTDFTKMKRAITRSVKSDQFESVREKKNYTNYKLTKADFFWYFR